MEAIVTRPVVSGCCRAVSSRTASSRLLLNTTPSGARQQSSTSRTKKALIVPPHAAFFKLNGSSGPRPTTDQIIFNPPSSAPSVYHTPFKFLPKSDPRRRANLTSELFSSSAATTHQSPTATTTTSDSPFANTLAAHEASSASSTAPASPEDFPALTQYRPPQKPHHLTKEDIEELRRLRAADPVANSVQNLARQYRCSKLFILMCCRAPQDHKEKIQAAEEAVKNRWGPRRRQAREERARRMEMLFSGEL
jgi:hypothetical protein